MPYLIKQYLIMFLTQCWTVFIFLYCILPHSLCAIKWQINFNQNEPPNTLHITLGQFTSFNAVISPHTNSSSLPEHSNTTLTLSDSSGIFTTPQPSYIINTRDAFTFPIEIGVSCQSQSTLNETTITFISSSSDFLISNITVYIDTTINELPIHNYSSTVPLNGYGLIYFISKEIKNVDDIVVSFIADNATTDKAVIDVAVIKPYRNDISNKIYTTRYYALTPNESGNTFGFTVVYDNKCFKGEQRVSFTMTNEHFVANTNLFVNTIINTARVVNTKQQSKISISLNINVSPLVTYCVLQDMNSTFISSEDIINQTVIEDPMRLQYFSALFPSHSTYFITFDNVSQYISYKMKCIFKPAVNDVNYNNTSTTLTFGYFPSADVLLTIASTDIEPTPSHCMTWALESINDMHKEQFTNKALEYCYTSFIHPYLPRNDNGCIECVERNVDTTIYPTQHDQQVLVSICAKSQDNCISHYQGDFALKFKEVSESLNSTEGVYAMLGVNYTVSGFYVEDDEVAPNERDIYITDFSLSRSEVTFKAFTNENKKVECKATVQQRSALLLSSYAFNNESFILNDDSHHVVHFNNGDEYDGRLYNMMFQCYNIPKYKYSFKKTKAFTVAQFIRRENELPLTNETLPITCNSSTKYNEQCVETPYHSLSPLQTLMPLKDHINEFKEYRNKEIDERYIYIDNKLNEIRDDTLNISTKFETIVFITELLSSLQCKTYIDFAECRRYKKDTMRVIINEINKHIGNANYIEQIIHSDNEIQTANAKLVLLSLFYTCNNADSFDYANTTITVINILNNVYKHFAQLLELFNEQHMVVNDLIKIFIGALDNVIDVFTFNEVDGTFKGRDVQTGLSKINMNTHFIRDIHYAILPELIVNCSSYIHLHSAMPFTLTHFNYSVHEIRELHPSQQDEQYQNITVGDTVISLSVNHLVSENAKYLAVVRYYDYPLFSYAYRSTDENVPVLSLKVMNDEKEIIHIKNMPEPKKIFLFFNNLPNDVQFCYYFSYDNVKGDTDISNMDFDHKGIVTDQTELHHHAITCQLSHLSEFTVGKHDIKGKIYTSGMNSWVIGLISVLSACACLNVLVLLVKVIQSVKNKDIESSISEQFVRDTQIINQSNYNDE